MIYLDYNATTPVLPEVGEAMESFFSSHWGNPSSPHTPGRVAAAAVARARIQVASLVGATPEEVVFTGSATEANNTALASGLAAGGTRRRIVTAATEHSAVLGYCAALARQGVEIVIVPVLRNGMVDLGALERAASPGTALVSIMWANNETGVLNPIEAIARLCAERQLRFHCDAAQAAGKVPVDLARVPVDYLTLSSHKLYGPKGIGALLVRSGAPFSPLILGGHQEGDRRGGTENVPAIAGFGCAAELARAELSQRAARVAALRDELERCLLAEVPGACVHGAGAPRLPNTSNLGFPGVDAESLVQVLDTQGVCVSAGSACLANSPTPSHVVHAMTGSYARAGEAVRFSLSHLNTAEEIRRTLEILKRNLPALTVA